MLAQSGEIGVVGVVGLLASVACLAGGQADPGGVCGWCEVVVVSV